MTVKAVAVASKSGSGNDRDSGLQVRSKIWLEMDGEPVFGRGREVLLRFIQKTGSINAAAKAMGISHREKFHALKKDFNDMANRKFIKLRF
jgi:molybdenum-dependent DNA-binding transcriptional regulator ModE